MACCFGFCNWLFWRRILLVSMNGSFGTRFWFLLPVVLACPNDPAARACWACLSSLFRNNRNHGNNLRRHGRRSQNDQHGSTDSQQQSSNPSQPQQQWAPLPYVTTVLVTSQQLTMPTHMSQEGVILEPHPPQAQAQARYAAAPSSQFGSTMSLTQPDNTDPDTEYKHRKMNHMYKMLKRQLQLQRQQQKRWWKQQKQWLRQQKRRLRQQQSQSVQPITRQELSINTVNLISDFGRSGNYSAASGSNFHEGTDTQGNGGANMQLYTSHRGDVIMGDIKILFDEYNENGKQEPAINTVNLSDNYRSGNYLANSGSNFHKGTSTSTQTSGEANLQQQVSHRGSIKIGNIDIIFRKYHAGERQAVA